MCNKTNYWFKIAIHLKKANQIKREVLVHKTYPELCQHLFLMGLKRYMIIVRFHSGQLIAFTLKISLRWIKLTLQTCSSRTI